MNKKIHFWYDKSPVLLNMGSKSGFLGQKLASLVHTVALFLIPIFSYLSRLQKFGFFWKKNGKDMIFLEGESDEDKSELHLKFKFPTFEEFSRIQKGRGDSKELESASSRRSVSAFIEVLTTFPLKEINGDENGGLSELFLGRKLVKVDEEIGGVDQRNVKIDNAKEFAENKVNSVLEDWVDESEFLSERSSDGFLSDGDFGERLDFDSENEAVASESDTWSLGENKESLPPLADEVGEIKKVEENDGQKLDLSVNSDKKNGDGIVCVDDEGLQSGENKLESLWEHQELIEQLQMELRKVKATGLPTILEESESPKIIDDLKPWKIDENHKLQHDKSYREMMRKFDILNYQKMYAMGFLQLKDPFQVTSQPAPKLKSLVSENLWLFKHKKHGSNPIRKLIKELEGDVEAVYVGQMCLSWEFLHWQYGKALDLWNSDQQGVHRYNEVAGEFQQFQVLVQRFTEDEPFQGPRVQSYVKSRCVLRNLLQVPVIREDCLGTKEMDEYAITSEMLVEMVEESIRIFWNFVRSDKDCTVASSSASSKLLEPRNPEDIKLLIQLRKNLQKKERKLKEIVRSESCILRKFRKRKEDDSDQALHFFAQVDMKLVCRVLNMSRISREQLIWCQNKLSRISIGNKKVCVEPAFLLFPC